MGSVTKSVSTLAIFFILFLVMFEVPETEAQDIDECFREYGGDDGRSFCSSMILPQPCFRKCQQNKNAMGGVCHGGSGGQKCLCDFCVDNYG